MHAPSLTGWNGGYRKSIPCILFIKFLKFEQESIKSTLDNKGLRPYYVISYNKQGSFQMITEDYNNGPRVLRKDYVLWKIQNMQETVSMPSSHFSIMSLMAVKLKLKNYVCVQSPIAS